MFNIENLNPQEFNYSGARVILFNISNKGYYVSFFGTDSPTLKKYSVIEKYDTNKDDLVIYEKMAIIEKIGDTVDLYKFHDKNSVKTLDYEGKDMSYDEIDKDVEKYIKSNIDDFATFKHTFKKNDTGYYWYQTEVEM